MKRIKLALGLSAALPCVLTVALADAVGTRNFHLAQGEDFEGGDLQGVAVDSVGQVRAGFSLEEVPLDETGSVWALSPGAGRSSLLLGTGNDGKLLRVQGTAVEELADDDSLVVTSIARAFGQTLLGTLPAQGISKLNGHAIESFVELEGVEHVWQLAVDEPRGVLYAATGPEGKLWRITKDGRAEVYFDASEEHLLSLAVAADGSVFVGSSESAKIYHVTGPGRASVLFDFGSSEVRGIAVGAQGSVFAIANEIKGGSIADKQPTSRDTAGAKPAKPAPKTKGKGSLYEFPRQGGYASLLENKDEHFTALAIGDDGLPYVGTGVEGRVYTVDDARNSILVADTKQRQVTALHFGSDGGYVATSDPATLYRITGRGGADAVWTSKVLDAAIQARFGRLRWVSTGALELSTRTGNTGEPDDTWSPWSGPHTSPGLVTSPPGRFIQIRARWGRDARAVLHELILPFVTENLRAVVTQISAGKASHSSVGTGVAASGGPISGDGEASIPLSWKVDNPDEDTLRYRVQYRPLGNDTWFDLLKPLEVLTATSYKWDTSTLPEGRYKLRVSATDELANPPDRVTRHQLESSVLLVDNTQPRVEALRAQGRTISGAAVDAVGPIQRIELAVAGTDEWYPFYPADGIFDEPREEFSFDVGAVVGEGPQLLAIRVFDDANNSVIRHVTLK